MPTPRHSTTTRRAISDDPSLSPHANHVLTDELQAVIGSDSAEVPSARPDHAGERHGTHSAFVTIRLSGETEHVAPQTAAALEEEGIGDPDRVLTDLVKDFTTARENRSKA